MKIVHVQLKGRFVVYRCDAGEESYKPGDFVVVLTKTGEKIGTVISKPLERNPEHFPAPANKVLRLATDEDRKRQEEEEKRQSEALKICRQKVGQLNLPMKLVDADFAPGGEKVTFFFIAESRVNFRDLVKQLASELHMRIEMRQIGARNVAQTIGGIGCCGRPLCCTSFLSNFDPVSIRMAKDQGLSLDPAKISGLCGRLLCCLSYECRTYEELKKNLPAVNSRVMTVYGGAKVLKVNVIAQTVNVELEDGRQLSIASEDIQDPANHKDAAHD
ncbi:MAG: stage 0 sporulation protein [Deltaproteobacteria bacterium]|nr:stage 0 sporulation protein [Deltaproteobacteria bacterium]